VDAIKHWLIQELLYEWLSELFPNTVKGESFTDYELLQIASTVNAYALMWLVYIIPAIGYLNDKLEELANYLTCKSDSDTTESFNYMYVILLMAAYSIIYLYLGYFAALYWYGFFLLTGFY